MGGVLQHVLDTIAFLVKQKKWVEIVTLIVPEMNDSKEELSDIAQFIRALSPDIPWHVTAYHQDYKMKTREMITSSNTLLCAAEIGYSEGLHFVYSGNVMGHVGENTYCPNCKKLIITRKGYFIERIAMKGQACGYCSHIIPGRFQ